MTVMPNTGAWVSFPKSNPQASYRLFCLPCAGGSALAFRHWPDDLPTEIEVCAIQLPGRQNRLLEPPVRHMPSLVQMLAQALLPYLRLPFAFFGHSMGALIGFELARQLRRHHLPTPAHLFVASRRAPQLPSHSLPLSDLPDAQLWRMLRQLNGIPEDMLHHAELQQLVLPALRTDLILCETYTYTPEPPLSCPISAFGGLADWAVGTNELAAWSAQTRSAFTLRLFPGDHFFLNTTRRALIEAVSEFLS